MTLTAQYRPYRDEECTEGLDGDHGGWHDHEPRIQIYEKTTEELPFANRRRSLFWIITLSAMVGAFGFLIGYFSHTSHSECIHNKVVSLDAIRDEDPTIRAKLLSAIDPDTIGSFAREFAANPHIAGSGQDLQLAHKIHTFFSKHHFHRSVIKNYTVLLSLPDERKPNFVSVVNPATNHEVYSSKTAGAFCPYSPSGDVTGDVLFVNYGRPVDYLQLQELFNASENIFKGKILLAKQFHLSASEQYKYATIMNASALLLYPDPEHYNPNNEKPFPDSVWLPPDGVRSDAIFWNGAGDPETFGLPANVYTYKDRMEFNEQISHIPAQPISAECATVILQRLGGPPAPSDWKGGLNSTYKVGPGLRDGLKVRVMVNNRLENKTIHNVIGTIRGRVEPDRYVIVGNQRDSLSKGAVDSAAGSAAFLELARVFGDLVASGWKPRRSIVFCSWGAEEFNLIGSTEFVEETLKILYMRAVAYININLMVTGNDTLSVAASPLLYHAIFNATKEVVLPPTEHSERSENFDSVYDKWIVSMPVMRNSSTLILQPSIVEHLAEYGVDGVDKSQFVRNRNFFHREESSDPGTIFKTYLESAFREMRPHIRPLDMYGSYAPFYTIAGIPILDISFVQLSKDERDNRVESDEFEKFAFGHTPYPLLHTQYDDIEAIVRFIDPKFQYHKVVGQILAEVVRDLADSLFLPFNLFDYAQLLKDFYVKSMHLHSAIILSNKNDEESANLDFMYLDMKSLESAIQNFTNEAIKFHARQDKLDLTDPMEIRRINDKLLLVERQFLDHRGIPSNNLKRHLILSPAETLSSINALETDGLFPALLDELDQIIGNVFKKDIQPSLMRLQKHLPILIHTIQSAAESLTVAGDYF